MRNTLLLVFIHGFKGSDTTFKQYPWDLQKLIAKELPRVDVLSIQYPQFETRGDFGQCIVDFGHWLHDKVMEIEVAKKTPSPATDPSVHVILVGHSMGGLVAAETLLRISRKESLAKGPTHPTPSQAEEILEEESQRVNATEAAAPPPAKNEVFFPCVKAILALDTPFLGISPSVIAFGAEDGWGQAAAAWKSFTEAGEKIGLRRPSPPPESGKKGGWTVLGKVAMYSTAAVTLAGAAGAAYFNWKKISAGASWVGSHLEFISCLGKGEELKKRLESVIRLTETHGIGFAEFYVALGDKMTREVQYTGSFSSHMLGPARTFVYVPQSAITNDAISSSPKQSPRQSPTSSRPPSPHLADEMNGGDKVEQFAKDPSKSKGKWLKCVNEVAGDELTAHRTMFIAPKNPGYFTFLLPNSRDQILEWVDQEWYERSEWDGTPAERPHSVYADEEDEFDLD